MKRKIPRINPYAGQDADDNADWVKRISDMQKRDLEAHDIALQMERERRKKEQEEKPPE